MREHASALIALLAMALILGAALVMSRCGLKDSSILVVLITGAVTIGQAIAGLKSTAPPPPAGTTTTFVQTPALDPNAQPAQKDN